MKKSLTALVFASTLAFGGLALAQEPTAAIGNQVGQVTVSTGGGDFRSAASGQALKPGDRVMLVDGSAVTLNFPNGCSMNFNKPGVYTVPAVCTAGVAATGVDWTGAAIIAGTAAVVAAGLNSMDEERGPDCVPVSAAPPGSENSCVPPESR
jgi:hypothetical protein